MHPILFTVALGSRSMRVLFVVEDYAALEGVAAVTIEMLAFVCGNGKLVH